MTHPFPNWAPGGREGEDTQRSPTYLNMLWAVPATHTPNTSPVWLQETQQVGHHVPPDAHRLLIIWKLLQCVKESPLGCYPICCSISDTCCSPTWNPVPSAPLT